MDCSVKVRFFQGQAQGESAREPEAEGAVWDEPACQQASHSIQVEINNTANYALMRDLFWSLKKQLTASASLKKLLQEGEEDGHGCSRRSVAVFVVQAWYL